MGRIRITVDGSSSTLSEQTKNPEIIRAVDEGKCSDSELKYAESMTRAEINEATVSAKAFMTGLIERAVTDHTDLLRVRAIPADKLDSGYFQIIGAMLDPIVKHAMTNSMPERIEVVCQNDEVADYHRMVYNYWYASSKDDRIMNDSWD